MMIPAFLEESWLKTLNLFIEWILEWKDGILNFPVIQSQKKEYSSKSLYIHRRVDYGNKRISLLILNSRLG